MRFSYVTILRPAGGKSGHSLSLSLFFVIDISVNADFDRFTPLF